MKKLYIVTLFVLGITLFHLTETSDAPRRHTPPNRPLPAIPQAPTANNVQRPYDFATQETPQPDESDYGEWVPASAGPIPQQTPITPPPAVFPHNVLRRGQRPMQQPVHSRRTTPMQTMHLEPSRARGTLSATIPENVVELIIENHTGHALLVRIKNNQDKIYMKEQAIFSKHRLAFWVDKQEEFPLYTTIMHNGLNQQANLENKNPVLARIQAFNLEHPIAKVSYNSQGELIIEHAR